MKFTAEIGRKKNYVNDGARRVRRFGGATVAIVSSGQQEGSENGHQAIRNRNQKLKTPNDSKAKNAKTSIVEYAQMALPLCIGSHEIGFVHKVGLI